MKLFYLKEQYKYIHKLHVNIFLIFFGEIWEELDYFFIKDNFVDQQAKL